MAVLAEPCRFEGLDVEVADGDIGQDGFIRARSVEALAWDTETTGLDWRRDRLATVQVLVGDRAHVVRLNGRVPQRLKQLLEDEAIAKVMHHAMFDLRFMASRWGAVPAGVVCTKVASKLAFPDAGPRDHSLAALVSRNFGVELDKSQRLTDWAASKLTSAQLRYAADDVRFLEPLYELLEGRLRDQGLLDLRDRCYEHLPTRLELELRGYADVFSY